MDTLTILGTAAGLGLMAGIRLYACVFAVGLAVRLHWLTLPQNISHLAVLGDTRILVAAGIACAMEFFADKIPIVDSVWDGFHTFIRPVGAALIGLAAAYSLGPVEQVVIFLLTGGVALTSHATKAGTRVMANHSPEPFSNMILSFAEDGLTLVGAWLAVKHPILMLALVCAFLVLFVFIARKMFRLLNRALAKLRRRLVGAPENLGHAENVVGPAAPDK